MCVEGGGGGEGRGEIYSTFTSSQLHPGSLMLLLIQKYIKIRFA